MPYHFWIAKTSTPPGRDLAFRRWVLLGTFPTALCYPVPSLFPFPGRLYQTLFSRFSYSSQARNCTVRNKSAPCRDRLNISTLRSFTSVCQRGRPVIFCLPSPAPLGHFHLARPCEPLAIPPALYDRQAPPTHGQLAAQANLARCSHTHSPLRLHSLVAGSSRLAWRSDFNQEQCVFPSLYQALGLCPSLILPWLEIIRSRRDAMVAARQPTTRRE